MRSISTPAAIVAAEIHPADRGDTTTLPETLEAAEANLAAVDAGPTAEDPAELIADKGYHSRDGLKELEDGAWKSRIAEKKVPGVSRWHGDEAARRAVYNNRARLRSGVAKEAFKLRAELVERSFALDPRPRRHAPGLAARPREPAQTLSGPRRRLQSRPDHAAPGRRRHPTGVPGPSARPLLLLTAADGADIVILIVATDTEAAMLAVSVEPEPHD